MRLLPLLVLPMFCVCVSAWDNDELEIFDLVEELKDMTFYEYLEISNDAPTADVRRAYKRLALILHPDKSDDPEAEVKFRQLAAIYDTLKDKDKRAMYDRVLVEGLPNWKNPVFYFRKMRKIGLAEGLLYVLVIVTVCQYFINWAAYLERKFTISENVQNVVRRKQKRLRKEGKNEDEIANQMMEEEMEMMGPKPTCFDTLPFQLFRLTKYLLFAIPAIPGAIKSMYEEKQRLKDEKVREERELEEEKKWREEEKEKRKEAKATKRKNANKYREKAEDDDSCQVSTGEPEEVQTKAQPKNALSMWSDDDLVTLAKFIKKYPGGSADRWDQIADSMERFSWEVTKMAAKIKKNPNLVPISISGQGVTGREESIISDSVLEVETNRELDQDEDSETAEDTQESEDDGFVMYSVAGKEDYTPVEVKKKKKTKAGKITEEEEDDAANWSQEQQKSLEVALSQFPKGTSERWERISGKVGGKTKEQCMARFKHLAEMVKKKKEEAAQ